MTSDKPQKVGIRIEGGSDIYLGDNVISGMDEAVHATNVQRLTAVRNQIRDLGGEQPPAELLEAALTQLERIAEQSGRRPNSADAEQALESSGLNRWLVEHGVEVFGVVVALLALFKP